MDMNISRTGHLTTSEASEILKPLGYRWSNEAQCYYSTDFELALLTDKGCSNRLWQLYYPYRHHSEHSKVR